MVLLELGRHRSVSGGCDTLAMTDPGEPEQPLRRPASAPGGPRGGAAGLAWAVAVYFSLAMLATQTLGLLHGILHNRGYAAAATVANESSSKQQKAAADDRVTPGSIGSSNASFLTQLFSGHQGDTDCRAYDQLRHFDAAPGCAALALPLVLTPFLFSTLTRLATARWHALFQARGPPSLR